MKVKKNGVENFYQLKVFDAMKVISYGINLNLKHQFRYQDSSILSIFTKQMDRQS